MQRRVIVVLACFILAASVVAAQRPGNDGTSPPVRQDISQGFGQFLCEGPGCWDGPAGAPFGGRLALDLSSSDTLSKGPSFLGFPTGDRHSTVSLTGGADQKLIPWTNVAPFPLTPVLSAGLPEYATRPTDETLEISFSGTPFTNLTDTGQPYGSQGLGLATDCRVLENTTCSCTWNPGNPAVEWDTALMCTGMTRTTNGTYLRPYFFSVYPQGTGLTLTYSVSYHGYARLEKAACDFSACGPNDAKLVAKVRLGLVGVGLPLTVATDYQYVNSPQLMVSY